jgi:hypothetical protein
MHETMLYACAVHGNVCHHLIVERLPTDRTWDWAVWTPGSPPETARQGIAPSAEDAMTQAEACVLMDVSF